MYHLISIVNNMNNFFMENLGLIIICSLAFFFAIFVISKYNSIIQLRNYRDQAFADVDVLLKMRFDLIPNLIEIVKWYVKHEQTTLENVTKARTQFLQAGNNTDKMDADNMLTETLKSLFAVSEDYPDLKANQNFLELQSELWDVENKISAWRRFFNNATQEYNTYIEMFPTNLVAKIFGFQKQDMFSVSKPEQRENVKISF